jgi:hypothetical protein
MEEIMNSIAKPDKIKRAVKHLAATWSASRLTLGLLIAAAFNIVFTVMATISAFTHSIFPMLAFAAVTIASGFAVNIVCRAIELRMGEPRSEDE